MSVYPQRFNPYSVFGRSDALGVIVALRRFAATITVAGTMGPPFSLDRLRAVGMVSSLTGSLNKTCGLTLRPTLSVPFGGSSCVTNGPLVWMLVPVSKLKLPGFASGLPTVSVIWAV